MAGETLSAALAHVWKTLKALNAKAALIGGMAVAAWKHARNTRDVDYLGAWAQRLRIESPLQSARREAFP